MVESWQEYLNELTLDIFYRPGHKDRSDTFKHHYNTLYTCYPKQLIALMFYLRSVKDGRGEKDISYEIALWVLNKDEELFMKNYNTYITKIGCFKDCLHLAQYAIDQCYSDDKILKLLAPMALALGMDEFTVTQTHLNQSQSPPQSLAAKWAPRKGKAFNSTIPYLKKLCNITGKNSDEKWRKYIQYIIKANPIRSIETHLSNANYDKINFDNVPNKALKLYYNTIKNNKKLHEPYFKFIENRVISSKLLGIYSILSTESKEQQVQTQLKWGYLLNNYKQNIVENQNIYLPIIDLSCNMLLNKGLPMQVAMTLGNIMTCTNADEFYKKTITFSNEPHMYDITGDTIQKQIHNIFNNFEESNSSTDVQFKLNYSKMLTTLLQFYLMNSVSRETARKLSVVVFSCKPLSFTDYEQKKITNATNKFLEFGYTAPSIIYWNLNDSVYYNTTQMYGVQCISGFDKHILNNFLINKSLKFEDMPLNILEDFTKLIV